MECLKCRRETQAGEVFCPECLKVMAASPVKPGTPVTLPRRDSLRRPVPQKKAMKPEEVIAKLRKKIRLLLIAVVVLGLLLAASLGCIGFFAYREWTRPDLGSNYSTISTETSQPSAPAQP